MLSNVDTALWAVTFVSIWKTVPTYTILALAGLQQIPVEYKEAAIIDGANEWQVLTRIKLPLLSPTLFFVLFISIKDALLICAPVMVMTEGGPFRSTQTIVYYYYIEAFRNSNYSAAAAISTVVFIIAAIITSASAALDSRRVHYEN